MKSRPKALTAILLAIIAAAAVTWQLSGTTWVDDWNYRFVSHSNEGFWGMSGEPITTLSQAWDSIVNQHSCVTPRLANYLQTLAELIPDWVTRVFMGLTLALGMTLIAVMAAGRRVLASPGFVALTWLAAWLTLPLNDFMISTDYGFNYIASTLPSLLYAKFFVDGAPSRRSLRRVPWAMAVIAGAMHEGAAMPLAAGSVMMILTDRADRPRRAALTAVITATSLFFVLAPGTTARIGAHILYKDHSVFIYMLVNLLIESFGLYFALLALALVAFRRGAREALGFAKANILWLTAIVAAMVIAFAAMMRGRALWFTDVFGLVVLFKALWLLYPALRRPHPVMAAAATAIVAVSCLTAARYQRILSDEADALRATAIAADSPVVFTDHLTPDRVPWWALGIPVSPDIIYSNAAIGMSCPRHWPMVVMLPRSFEGLDPELWPKFPGNTGLAGRYPFFASRHRLPQIYTFAITFGPDNSLANPLCHIINPLRDKAKGEPNAYPFVEYPLIYRGDTLWCYNIVAPRRLDRNRPVVAIDIP